MLKNALSLLVTLVLILTTMRASANEQNTNRDELSLQIPSDALAGEVVPVRISAANPSMEDRIGTLAISVLSDDVEVVNTSEGTTTINPHAKTSQLPIFQKSDSGWLMAPKSQWPTAKNTQIELYSESWHGHEPKELVVFLRFAHAGPKQIYSRATFGKKAGKAHVIEANMPTDGPLDQMQLPAQVSILTVSQSVPADGSNAVQDLAAWEGTYNFVESTQSSPDASMVWDYTLSITGAPGELTIDGYQTQSHYICSFLPEGGELKVFLDSYGPDNQFEPFQEGDLLFLLERTGDNSLVTRWGKLSPNVFENLIPGQHFASATSRGAEIPSAPKDEETTATSTDESFMPNATPDSQTAVAVAAAQVDTAPEQANTPLSISATGINEGANMEMLGELLESISMKDLLYFLLFLTLIFSVMAGMFKFIRILADVVIVIAGTVAALGCVVASKTMPFGEAVISSILVGLVLAVLCTPLLPLSRLYRIRDSAVTNQKTED